MAFRPIMWLLFCFLITKIDSKVNTTDAPLLETLTGSIIDIIKEAERTRPQNSSDESAARAWKQTNLDLLKNALSETLEAQDDDDSDHGLYLNDTESDAESVFINRLPDLEETPAVQLVGDWNRKNRALLAKIFRSVMEQIEEGAVNDELTVRGRKKRATWFPLPGFVSLESPRVITQLIRFLISTYFPSSSEGFYVGVDEDTG